MNFLNPLGLLGFFSLPVIIGLHMHRDRSRQFIVSSLNLWSFLEVQLRGSKSRKIRITWLLVIDLLIAILFILALARPEITSPFLLDRSEHIIILLDDSTSMLASDDETTRFNLAVNEIQSLLDDLNSRDIVSVHTFGGEVVFVGDSRNSNIHELSTEVGRLQAGDVGVDIPSALSLALSSVTEQFPVEIHIYTDGAYDDPGLLDVGYPIHWHFFRTSGENQAVTSVRATEISDYNYQVFVNLLNFGSQISNREVQLIVDGLEVDRATVELPPQAVISQVWNLSGQPQSIMVELSDSDVLPGDDSGGIGISQVQPVRVALVSDNPSPVDRAILSAPNVDLNVIQPDEIFSSVDYDLIVYRGNLPQNWPIGNILVLEPPQGSQLLSVHGSQKITGQLEFEDVGLFIGVEFNGLRWGSAIDIYDMQDQLTPLLWVGDSPLLLVGKIDNSDITIFLPLLDEGNLTRHPFFPIFITNLVSASGGFEFPDQIDLGSEIELPSSDEYPTVVVTNLEGEEISLLSKNQESIMQTKMAGIYHIELTDINGEVEKHSFAVNAGSLIEGDLTSRTWTDNVESFAEGGGEGEVYPVDLSPWLLCFALVLIFSEVLLAWR